MIDLIWIIIIIISLVYGIFTNNMTNINKIILDLPKNSLNLMIDFSASIIFWNGILNVAKDGGFLSFLTKYIKKIIKPFFKEVPFDSLALDYIAGNIAANILGLGNAATPLGIKAIKELELLNNNKKEATKPMITLIILNTTGFTILPTTILALRNSYNANITVQLIPIIILVSFIITIIGLFINHLFKRSIINE